MVEPGPPGRRQILVVSPLPIVDGAIHGDAFPARYALICDALRDIGDVRVLYVSGHAAIDVLTAGAPEGSRLLDRRVVGSPRWDAYRRLAGDLASLVVDGGRERAGVRRFAVSPSVVVGLHPWSEDVLPPSLRGRTILVAEEDFEGSFGAPQREALSHPVRARQWVSRHARVARRRLRGPRVVTVIAPAESARVQQSFPRSEVVVWPHVLGDEWFAAIGNGERLPNPLCVGHFGAERNAAGLAATLDALDPAATTVHVYGRPPHPLLEPYLGRSLEYRGYVDDVRALYDRYRTSLVPAGRVSGVKTQVLQGWARGHVVVASVAASRSVGGRPDEDLLVGESPEDLATHLRSVEASWPAGVATAGRRTAESTRRAAVLRRAVEDTVEAVISRASLTAGA